MFRSFGSRSSIARKMLSTASMLLSVVFIGFTSSSPRWEFESTKSHLGKAQLRFSTLEYSPESSTLVL